MIDVVEQFVLLLRVLTLTKQTAVPPVHAAAESLAEVWMPLVSDCETW